MYEKWLSSEDLEPTWQSYFEGFELGKNFELKTLVLIQLLWMTNKLNFSEWFMLIGL